MQAGRGAEPHGRELRGARGTEACVLSRAAASFRELLGLQTVLKSKDIALPIKVRIVKGMVFPVVTYRCES